MVDIEVSASALATLLIFGFARPNETDDAFVLTEAGNRMLLDYCAERMRMLHSLGAEWSCAAEPICEECGALPDETCGIHLGGDCAVA